jgi:hypothetical protein
MERIKLLEKANKYRNKLGYINRQLAFAAIAVIWIFKIKNGENYGIPADLFLAVKYIVASLIVDVFHHFWLTFYHVIAHWYFDEIKHKKKRKITLIFTGLFREFQIH